MFPIDNKKRIVTAYGKVHRANALAPEISVHVERIDIDKKEIYMVPLNYLHKIRIGTMIQDQKNLGYSTAHKYRYEENIQFSFDFNETEPENVIFEKNADQDEWEIGMEHPYSDDTVNDMKPQTSTVYAKMISEAGLTAYIPSLELLVSGYAPRAKKLIPYLCNFPLGGVVEYIKKNYIVERKDWFFDKLRKENFPKAKNSCTHHLTHHPVSRARASIIWTSMTLTEKKETGSYIAVLPYHPEEMTIRVSGFWTDEKKFVVQRINKVFHPSGCKTVPSEPVLNDNAKPSNTIVEDYFQLWMEEEDSDGHKMSEAAKAKNDMP